MIGQTDNVGDAESVPVATAAAALNPTAIPAPAKVVTEAFVAVGSLNASASHTPPRKACFCFARNCHRKAVIPDVKPFRFRNSAQPQYYLGMENDMGPMVGSFLLEAFFR